MQQSAFAPETDEVYLVLLTIDEASLSSPIRVVNNNEDITSNGNLFTAFPFKAELPNSKEGSATTAKLIIDNTSREIAEAIRTITSTATVLIQVIRAADPDTIEKTFAPFDLRNVKWNASEVSGDLFTENLDSEPFPAGEFTPAGFPAIF